MLTRYWSLSQHGQHQPLSIQIKGLATKYTTVKWPLTEKRITGTCHSHIDPKIAFYANIIKLITQ